MAAEEVPRPDAVRRQGVLKKRLEAMGLAPEPLAGGASLLVTLPLGKTPFETPAGPRPISSARFYTVGHDRVKFTSPKAFAFLPLVRILDCEKTSEIERRLRETWALWLEAQREARRWIGEIGGASIESSSDPVCRIALGLEDPSALAAILEPGRVVLPSRGPLSGFALERAEDRVYRTRTCDSAIDLEIDITSQLERLARSRRRDEPVAAPAPQEGRGDRETPILLVGPRFVAATDLVATLRERGFDLEAVRTIPEALDAFRCRTFEAVLVESRLDRADGIELIPALRSLPGILDLPIAILDERARPNRREQAKVAGASAYLASDLDAERLAPALQHMVGNVKKRRFSRYNNALSISWPGCRQPAVASSLSRAGLFVRSDESLPEGKFAIHVPDGPVGSFTVQAQLDPVHRNSDPHSGPSGIGVRFRRFSETDEERWISYLNHLHVEPIADQGAV